LAAAYVSQAGKGRAISTQLLELVFRACITALRGAEADIASATAAAQIASRNLLTKVLADLGGSTLSRRSAATCMVEAHVERVWRGAYSFDVSLRLEPSAAPRGMTAEDVMHVARVLRNAALNGNGSALVVSLAHWCGVACNDLIELPLFSRSAGLIRLDASCGTMLIRLEGVLTELAKTASSNALPTATTLPLPLPRWIASLLLAFRETHPTALKLSDVEGLALSGVQIRTALVEMGLSRRLTAQRFVFARALPLMEAQKDAALVAFGTLDFSRAEKVSFAYQHLSHSELLEIWAERSIRLSWGELALSSVPAGGYCSAVTPSAEALRNLGARLSDRVHQTRPGPNAGSMWLRQHHTAVVTYVGLMAGICLALRGQEKTLLPAALLTEDTLQRWRDKALPNSRTQDSIVIVGPTLRLQLSLLRAHYRALASRLRRLARSQGRTALSIADQLDEVVSGIPNCPLLVELGDESIEAFTPLNLQEACGTGWVGKGDALRHAVHDLLRVRGVEHVVRETQLRHTAGSRALLSPLSTWSQHDVGHESARCQELLLDALQLIPVGGLIQSLERRA